MGVKKSNSNGNKTTIMEYFGKSTDTKPNASNLRVGSTFFEIDTQIVYMSDGKGWVRI